MTLPKPFAAIPFKALIAFNTYCWSPTLFGPIFRRRSGLAAQGPGHNATTVKRATVVTTVVGFFRWISTLYPLPTTPQRQNPDTYMYTCAPVRKQGIIPLWPLWRCAFLYLFDNLKEKNKKGHNGSHNGLKFTVVTWFKSLKNLNKGGFCCG